MHSGTEHTMRVSARDYVVGAPAPADGPTFGALFTAAAARGGSAAAIVGNHGTVSWDRWHEDADALARGLQELGVGPGDVVAAQLPNGDDFLTVHVAVALIGAVLLPLHTAAGTADLATLIDRGRARVFVGAPTGGRDDLVGSCPSLRHVLYAGPDADDGRPGTLSGLVRRWSGHDRQQIPVRPDDPFVLLATSGTTSSRPKICVHSHQTLLGNAAAVSGIDDAGPDDVLLCACPLTHAFGLLSIHLSLLTGGAQAILANWHPERLLAVTSAAGVTRLFAVPAQLDELAGHLDRTEPARRPALRAIRTGGAQVPPRLVSRLTELTGARVDVQWGMSEAGAGMVTRASASPRDRADNVGSPVPGAEARVVGEDGQVLGDGTVGALQVRGPYVFRGYLGEPELTTAAFTADGWLRTGDLATRLPGGRLAIRGRSTDVINVGGRKVHASEIEQLLADLPGLGPMAVVGRQDERLGEYPCLVVTAPAGVDLDAVSRHLKAKGVAEYKHPVALVRVERLPLTPTGKVARGRLADLVRSSPTISPQARASSQPAWVTRTDALRLVLDHARAVIGDDTALTPDTTFRDAGLSSVAAVRLSHVLGAALGRELASTIVFDYPTPVALADHLSGSAVRGESHPPEPEPATGGGRGPADADDPVVVVGMACRLPGGVNSPDQLWRLLVEGRDTVGGFPTDRGWPVALGGPDAESAAAGRGGGFLAADGFDAAFFGITPDEARAMDPQQRIVLEVAWEALEHAGVVPDRLRDSDTGVFLGMMPSDYLPGILERPDRYRGQSIIGNSGAVASGRISYFLGVRGPAVTIDTACSSSLVALHQARRAVQQGECALALVGGVTVMSTPASFVEFQLQGALSQDGRCRSFADGADGAGWSEGAAVLVVERQSTARTAGRRVLAVLRGGAVNSDGASNGLTAPNGAAQLAVLRAALDDARLTASDVTAVEAHGTGTALGDPIEARAIMAAYGAGRTGEDECVWLGSIKSNIGHTQAAAGIVGVIKMVLAMERELLPRSLHAESPTRHVDWSSGTVRLLQRAVPWPRGSRPRRAGISAFGIGGTNAHVIVEEGDVRTTAPAEPRTAYTPWVLSARTSNDLTAVAGRLAAAVRERPSLRDTPDAVGATLAHARSTFPHRAVVLPDADGDYLPGLDAIVRGTVTGPVARDRAPTVFVFPGHGSQWAGMGEELLGSAPVFAKAVAACDDALRPHTGWSVEAVLAGRTDGLDQYRPDVAQPLVFTMMVALAALWESHGVRPDAVVGHSQGEIAAAYVAGALSLADAAMVVAVRSRLLGALRGRGTMAAVRLSADQAQARISPWADRLAVAAVNGPRSVVVSGDNEAMAGFLAASSVEGVDVRPLRIDFASHCAQVDEILPEIQAELAGIRPRTAAVPFFSTADRTWLDGSALTPEYWCRNLRGPVGLYDATRRLAEAGFGFFLEVSAHPVLTTALEQTADELGRELVVLDTLHRDDSGLPRFLRAFGDAYCRGVNVDWRAIFPTANRALVDLPTYPFRHQRLWYDDIAPQPRRQADDPAPRDLGARLAALPAAEAETLLVGLVRDHAVAVAGFADRTAIAPDDAFADRGFGSLQSTRLAAALSRETGFHVSPSVLLDQPTPHAVARHLLDRVRQEPADDLPQHLGDLVSAACASGKEGAALDILTAAAALRRGFSGAVQPPAPVTISRGERQPVLLCFPSVTAVSGPVEYGALAPAFTGLRDVHVLPQPGFVPGEQVPDNLESLVATQCRAVRRCADERPFVLCGHSSGGWIAHAVSSRLVTEGHAPLGLVLLDSFWPDSDLYANVLPRVLAALATPARDIGLAAVGMTRLTAMGAYLRILAGWTPRETGTPTLFVQATGSAAAGLRPARWRLPHDLAVVDADHLDMVTSRASVIASTIETWLARQGS
jgi:acyl transferase domain-containing protein/acyl-CoA synthetase (AMP-forming)/AMP-acid ligase II